MDKQAILSCVDHTLLSQTATEADIQALCEDAVRFGTASVCVSPAQVRWAKACVANRTAVCTVIGFPNGYATTAVKCFETAEAIRDGADEIDMVVNLGWVREQRYDRVLEEIRAVKAACGDRLLKVIVETCLLTEDEKIRLCRVVSESGADYIKTSTGFSTGGATRDDVALFAEHVAPHVKIKAAGGIANWRDAEDFLSLGASRLGTSRLVRLMKEQA